MSGGVVRAIGLCRLTGQFFGWLPSAAQNLLNCGGWGLRPELPADGDGPVAALATGRRAHGNAVQAG